jgi:hypothetical protein
MVDRLRQALAELEPPICPSCDVDMRWTQSALVAPDIINHLFFCPNCHRTGKTISKVQVIVVPPDKLANSGFTPRAA